MDPQVPTSFIPKKPLDGGRSAGGAFGGLLSLLALFIFVGSIFGAAGVFLYQSYLNQSIAQKSDSLTKAQGAFDPSTITDLIRLDSRLNNAGRLLQGHVAISPIFNFLSSETLANVEYNSFEYTLQDNGSATVLLGGQADSFSTVALQSDQFSASKVFKDVIFSGITVDPTGKILFNVAATVDPSFINYGKSLGTFAPQQPAVPAAPAATDASSTASTTQQ